VRPVSLELVAKTRDCNSRTAILKQRWPESIGPCPDCGQICLGTEPVYVHVRYSSGSPRAARSAETLKPDTRPKEYRHRAPHQSQASRQGVEVLPHGDRRRCPPRLRRRNPADAGRLAGGAGYNRRSGPTCPNPRGCTREIFGPCCHIAPFSTRMRRWPWPNDTPYGLAATVWTRDVGEASAWVRCGGGSCGKSWFLRDLRTLRRLKALGNRPGGRDHSLEFYSEASQYLCG